MKDEERRDLARASFSPVVRQHSRRRRLPLPPFVTRYLPQTEHRSRTGLQLLDRGGGGGPPPPQTSHLPQAEVRHARAGRGRDVVSNHKWHGRSAVYSQTCLGAAPPRWSDCSHRLSRTANPSALKKETCQIHAKPGFDSSGT